MMQLSDLESRLLNCQKEESDMAEYIYGEIKAKTLPEALQMINELRRIMAVMHLQIKQNE